MMKKLLTAGLGLAVSGAVGAEDVTDVTRMVCASGQAQICLETGDCYAATPWELSVPDFVIIDTKKGTISTTQASGLNRSTAFTKTEREEGLIYLQGVEGGRAFSFVIHEQTGRLTAAIARDGISVTVFGACTAAKL
jgi:hypothetical protein